MQDGGWHQDSVACTTRHPASIMRHGRQHGKSATSAMQPKNATATASVRSGQGIAHDGINAQWARHCAQHAPCAIHRAPCTTHLHPTVDMDECREHNAAHPRRLSPRQREDSTQRPCGRPVLLQVIHPHSVERIVWDATVVITTVRAAHARMHACTHARHIGRLEHRILLIITVVNPIRSLHGACVLYVAGWTLYAGMPLGRPLRGVAAVGLILACLLLHARRTHAHVRCMLPAMRGIRCAPHAATHAHERI